MICCITPTRSFPVVWRWGRIEHAIFPRRSVYQPPCHLVPVTETPAKWIQNWVLMPTRTAAQQNIGMVYTTYLLGSNVLEWEAILSEGSCWPGRVAADIPSGGVVDPVEWMQTYFLGEVLTGRGGCKHTFWGSCLPGWAGTPVMKSEVRKVRMTTERWQDGVFPVTGRSKWIGMSTTGIWLRQRRAPASFSTYGKNQVQSVPNIWHTIVDTWGLLRGCHRDCR